MPRKPDASKVTLSQIAREHGKNPSSVSRMFVKAGLKPGPNGYDRKKAEEILKEAELRDNSKADSARPRAIKTALECKILNEKLLEIQRKVIPIEEHVDTMRRHAQWVTDVFALWLSEVKAVTGDNALVESAGKLTRKALKRMRAEIEREGAEK